METKLYLVTTEGDCEGRSTNRLGYVHAFSPAAAALYFWNKGKRHLYQYSVTDVGKDSGITLATGNDVHLEGYEICEQRGYSSGETRFEFKAVRDPRAVIAEKVAKAGLTEAELKMYLANL